MECDDFQQHNNIMTWVTIKIKSNEKRKLMKTKRYIDQIENKCRPANCFIRNFIV